MFRIDDATAAIILPTPEAAGAEGYWTEGNPVTNTPATLERASWFNMVQEELRNIVLAGGGTPSKTTYNQVLLSIENLIEVRAGNYLLDTGAANAYVIALSPAITAYTNGMTVRVRTVNANTGASTLNSGGGVVPLVNDVGGALATGDVPAGSVFTAVYDSALAKFLITSLVPSQAITPTQALAILDPSLFYKLDAFSPAFIKTAAGTISVKAGSSVMVFGVKLVWAGNTAVTMPALTAGVDYAVYACTDGSIRADSSFSAPTGYSTANSRMIGGFHYGLVAPATTVAGGSFQTAAPGMVWTQPDVDLIAGIDAWSIWDLKYRPSAPNPRGFKRVPGFGWLAAYFLSTDPDTNGVSKYNTNVASGTVLPKVPLAAGGNGTATYAAPTWWDFNEILRSFGCRFPTEAEFNMAAFGTTEGAVLGGASSTIPATLRQPGYTSKFGIEQVSGHQWIWGNDSAGAASTAYIANGGRGQSHENTIVRVLLGGSRTEAAGVPGSRCSTFANGPGPVNWTISARAACDHVQLA